MYEITPSVEEHIVCATSRAKAQANLAAIEILNRSTGPLSDPESLDTLARFVGWGTLWKVFGLQNVEPWMIDIRTRLESAMTPDQISAAKASTQNAYYTSPTVVRAIWQVLSCLGYSGGRAIEPSCGVGYFAGFQPPSIQNQWTMVELDPMPAAITAQLYPEATVYNLGFESLNLPDETFDLAIGNVPFGNYQAWESRYSHLSLNIHNHFIAKCVDLVRPGGLVCLITSTGTLDSSSAKHFREWLRERVHLVAALRLPENAFECSGTGVTADLLVLQKFASAYDVKKFPIESCPTKLKCDGADLPLSFSEYFIDNPGYLLGTPYGAFTHHGRHAFALQDDGRDLTDAIVSTHAWTPLYEPCALGVQPLSIPPELQHLRPGNFCRWANRVYRLDRQTLLEVQDDCDCILDYLALKETILLLLDRQPHCADSELQEMQSELNHLYDSFVLRWGFLHSSVNLKRFINDPDRQPVMALEINGAKAPIFSLRTATSNPIPESVDSASDALFLCLNFRGHLDLPWIYRRCSRPRPEVLSALMQQGLIYLDRSCGHYVVADELASGNIRQKIDAFEAERTSPDWNDFDERALQLLYKALPRPVMPPASPAIKVHCAEGLRLDLDAMDDNTRFHQLNHTVEAHLGCTWIPVEVYSAFVCDLLECDDSAFNLQYFPSPLGRWSLKVRSHVASSSVKATTVHGNEHLNAFDLIQEGLNLSEPLIRDKLSDGTYIVNHVATEDCRAKLRKIKELFVSWLWSDAERSLLLVRIYNDKINVFAPRIYNGGHLILPGFNPELGDYLRPEQKDAVWRLTTSNAVLLGYEVGLGKTLIMIASAMERRRLGLSKKPLLVVLKSTLSDVLGAFRLFYPHAHLLTPEPTSFQKDSREAFLSSIAFGDYDCVVLTHEQYYAISMSPRAQLDFLESELAALEEMAINVHTVDGDTRKALERQKSQLRKNIARISSSPIKFGSLYFQQMGIDAVFFDEAHYLKNLGYRTKLRNVAGLPNSSSQRALDSFIKFRWLLDNGGAVFLSTGTPVSNSVAEIWTFMRMIALPTLQKTGLGEFDSFISAFCQTVSSPEITPTGKFKIKTRVRRFINLPEWMALVRTFSAIKLAEDSSVHRPSVVYVNESYPPSPSQQLYMQLLANRAMSVESRSVKPEEDNMLKITTDGRKNCLDPRLVFPTAVNFVDSKVNLAAWNIWQIWSVTEPSKAVQLMFCDFSTPSSGNGFDVYRYLRSVLIALGIPADQLAFIHDHDTTPQRKALYAKVNSGAIRVLFGSTGKLGTGVNVQDRALAIHHLDAPWRPSDIEQRNGRAQRHGNQWSNVWVFRYVTEGASRQAGFDSFMWQGLTTKAKFIRQVMRFDPSIRSLNDDSSEILNYSQMMALASGDPIIREKSDLSSELASLELQKRAHEISQVRIKWDIKNSDVHIDYLRSAISAYETDLQTVNEHVRPDVFPFTVQDHAYFEPIKATKHLLALCESPPESPIAVGSFCGLTIKLHSVINDPGYTIILVGLKHYRVAAYKTPALMLRELIYTIQSSIKGELSSAENELTSYRSKLADLLKEDGKPFEHEERLHYVEQRVKEIDAILTPALFCDSEHEHSEASEATGDSLSTDAEPIFLSFPDEPLVRADFKPVEMEIVAYLQQLSRHPDWLRDIVRAQDQFIGGISTNLPLLSNESQSTEGEAPFVPLLFDFGSPELSKKRQRKTPALSVAQLSLFG